MEIQIRKWEMTDAASLAAVLSNQNILKNLRDGLPYPYTEKDAADYISAMRNADPANTFAYAICLDGAVVGNITALRQENIHARTAELGYYLAEEHWRKGIVTEAVRRICRMLFTETDILRIFAEPFADNMGSRRVLEKAGFRLEGILKNNAVKNGKVLDMALYARTREPYEIRPLTENEIPEALNLAWQVFSEFESPVYEAAGTEEFRKCLHDETYLSGITYYGAFDRGHLVGEIGIRPDTKHICFFFVKGDCHRRGIGTRLFLYLRALYPDQTITLNSSPYGLPFYSALGFIPTGKEQTVNGIRFTPMCCPSTGEEAHNVR